MVDVLGRKQKVKMGKGCISVHDDEIRKRKMAAKAYQVVGNEQDGEMQRKFVLQKSLPVRI